MAPLSQALRFPVLLGDIGGTNARFAVLAAPDADPIPFPVVRTADFVNIDAAIRAGVLDRTPLAPRSAVLAIAAPVEGDETRLTNSPWVIRPRALITELGFEEVLVLNDFEAQALAVATLPETSHTQIGGGPAVPGAGRVVLGPGTGLGVGGLVRARGLWVPVAGEGGHVDLGARTPRDLALWPHLQPIEGRISAEQVLCGRGLINLYRAICAADAVPPRHADPAAVTDAAIAGRDPQALEAVRLFAVYLARVAGDLALIFMARGGVYIAGGIFQRILPAVDEAAMRAAFEDKAPHSALMRQIPLYPVTQPLAALAGLAAYARDPDGFGLETGGRLWTTA